MKHSLPRSTCHVYTYADLIVDYLAQIGVEYVFGVPGGAIEAFYNALAREARRSSPHVYPAYKLDKRMNERIISSPRAVIARHECGAAFMADGYARETGRLGVCCATTGPGATNLITGVASAFCDRIPMLVITPQTALANFGKLALQESSSDTTDVVGMFAYCTRYNSLVSHGDQLEQKLVKALLSAFQRPSGPAHLSIPMDILAASPPSSYTSFVIESLLHENDVVDKENLLILCRILKEKRNIVLFLGNDCHGGIDNILQFAERMHVPIVATPAGKRWVSSYHPLFRGVFGFAGHCSARKALLNDHVELVLAIGTPLDEISTGSWDKAALLNDKLVHIDATLENFSRSPMACLHVYGKIKSIFEFIFQQLFPMEPNIQQQYNRDNRINDGVLASAIQNDETMAQHSMLTTALWPPLVLNDFQKCLSEESPIKPQRLMVEIAKCFPESTRFFIDAGNAWAWTIHYLNLKTTQRLNYGFGFGAMGWAIGASIGSAFANPHHPTVCITGDGSYLMSGQEITVAIQYKLSVVFLLLNDHALGMVKYGQKLGGGELIGYQLPVINYAEIARTMGANAYSIYSPEDLRKLDFSAICHAAGPTLLDIHIDVNEVPPMGLRMKTLNRNKEFKDNAFVE